MFSNISKDKENVVYIHGESVFSHKKKDRCLCREIGKTKNHYRTRTSLLLERKKITDDFYFWFLDFIQMYEVIHVNIARNRSKLD